MLLGLERVDLAADYRGAGVQGENVADQGLSLSLNLDDVGDLDYGVLLGLWELALFGRALNVKGENAEGCDLGEVAVTRLALDRVEVLHVYLVLRVA